MDYFTLLNLKQEPFSNSPDPEFFFKSRQHLGCLQQLELALRLRRGLNVVIGEIGTGKSTLCRQLIRRFSGDDQIETHLVLDPDFATPETFMASVLHKLQERRPAEGLSAWQLREAIKTQLFEKGVEAGRTIILLIDEGQKIPDHCLEILREFLNFETNAQKLLQIVIFAQREFQATLAAHPNFADRVNLRYFLGPLSFADTVRLVRFRIGHASMHLPAPRLFSMPALWAVHRAAGGYPRRIIHLCHHSLMALIIQNRRKAGWRLVRSCAGRTLAGGSVRPRSWAPAAAVPLTIVAAATLFLIWRGGSDRVSAPVALLPAAPAVSARQDEAPIATGGTVAIAAAVPARLESANQEPLADDPPTLLGEIAIGPGETLSDLIRSIYGVFSTRYQALVLEANPQVRHPDTLDRGMILRFPAGPPRGQRQSSHPWCVALGEDRTLAGAIERLKRSAGLGVDARLLGFWEKGKGMAFATILKIPFRDENSARFALQGLSPEWQNGAYLLYTGQMERMFFGDFPDPPQRQRKSAVAQSGGPILTTASETPLR